MYARHHVTAEKKRLKWAFIIVFCSRKSMWWKIQGHFSFGTSIPVVWMNGKTKTALNLILLYFSTTYMPLNANERILLDDWWFKKNHLKMKQIPPFKFGLSTYSILPMYSIPSPVWDTHMGLHHLHNNKPNTQSTSGRKKGVCIESARAGGLIYEFHEGKSAKIEH